MNLKQKICLWVGIAIVALAAAGALLYNKDSLSLRTETVVVNVTIHELTSVELFVLLAGVIVVTTAVVLVTFKAKKPKDEQKE
jgi:hypothetical protein